MVVVKDNISIIVPVLSLEGLVPGPGLGLEGLVLGPGLEAYDVLANVTAQMSYFVSSATQNPDLQFALHQHERRQTQKTRHDENKQLFSFSLALSAWLAACSSDVAASTGRLPARPARPHPVLIRVETWRQKLADRRGRGRAKSRRFTPPTLYIIAAVAINTTVCDVIRSWALSHHSQTR